MVGDEKHLVVYDSCLGPKMPPGMSYKSINPNCSDCPQATKSFFAAKKEETLEEFGNNGTKEGKCPITGRNVNYKGRILI